MLDFWGILVRRTIPAGVLNTALLIALCQPLLAWQATSEPTSSERYQRFIKAIMTRCDANDDGVIDRTEKKKFYLPVLENADSNNDGLIHPHEILSTVAGPNSENPLTTIIPAKPKSEPTKVESETPTVTLPARENLPRPPRSIELTAMILLLPAEFTKEQAFSLKDIFKKISSEEFSRSLDEDGDSRGIVVLDQFELQVTDGLKSELQVGSETRVVRPARSVNNVNRSTTTRSSSNSYNLGSHLTLQPQIQEKWMLLDAQYEGTFKLPDRQLDEQAAGSPEIVDGLTHLQFASPIVLQDEYVSAINLVSSGRHFLVIISAKP